MNNSDCFAITCDRLDVLQWFAEKRGTINLHWIDVAVINKKKDIFEWLLSHHLTPSTLALNMTISDGNYDFADYLASLGYLPTEDATCTAMRESNDRALTWLAQHNIYPPM